MADQIPVRTEDGRFPKGVSGNPAGRPKGKKNEIVELRQAMEVAVRNHLDVEKIKRIIDRMAQMAEQGDVKAAKLLLDKIIPNARDDEDDDDKNVTRIEINIKNATFAAKHAQTTPQPVEGEFTEVSE